ncbi:NAD(P)H-quinone oxidoreductase [Hyphobacterium sp. CCMP332]|uniref:NAD(P)H-quinone oxidoreductase n=1 Tax=Hyphobacterium sp. CCMP332 TaxID=2749086 RepID=UPI00164F06E2|nr:NAD(P)H-quinone oxidoreductase [Hyphobacterium sp. CCMP332]QNL19550.1 NAD(P)H-quinone oxidoreductase [Hyphobacterium sp. CCMP332]
MSVPTSHRIAIAPEPGGPDAIGIVERPLPALKADEVLIRTAACGVNKPDTFERMGFYPPPPGAPEGLGLEAAGTIVTVGASVDRFKAGNNVCALVTGGGYSDYVIAKAGSTLPTPKGIELTAAAGLPETVFTVWANVFQAGQLKAGETLLVHGGAGGIGTTAIQMGKAAGARVFATAGTPEKCALCERLGADRAINYRDEDFVAILNEAGGANVILDMVGGPYVQKNINCAAFRGRIVQIAFLQGSRIEADLMRLMLKQLTLTGSTLRARPEAEKAELAKAIEDTVWPWIESGRFRPEIHATFPLENAAEAHRLMDAGDHAGKILLTP